MVDKPGKLASEWHHINGMVVSRLLFVQYVCAGDARIEFLSNLKRSVIYGDELCDFEDMEVFRSRYQSL